MLKRIERSLRKGVLPLLASLILASSLSFGIIWTLFEAFDVKASLDLGHGLTVLRIIPHVIASVVIGQMICILLLRDALANESKSVSQLADGTIYSPSNSVGFYDKIARKYDDRNSASLQSTHHKVIEIINSELAYNDSISVLDLGGGTGKLIASYYYKLENMRWQYVDESPAMLSQYKDNMRGSKIRTSESLEEIANFLKKTRSRRESSKYDIILMCLTLTSMESSPDWFKVAALLKTGGMLIIADIDASYTTKNPLYTVELDGKNHHLAPRAITLSNIISDISRCGMSISDTYPIRQNMIDYAFVSTFKKPAGIISI